MSRTRRVNSPYVTLMRFPAGGWAGSGSLTSIFSIPSPDARVQVTVKILFRPDQYIANAAIPFDTTLGARLTPTKILLQAAEQDDNGLLIPMNDLVGTGPGGGGTALTNGQIIPVSQDPTGLTPSTDGFSLDIQGGQGWVLGQIYTPYLNSATATGMKILLRARWNAVAEMCDPEWDEIVGAFQINAPTKEQVAV